MWRQRLAARQCADVARQGRALSDGEDAGLGTRMCGHGGAIADGEDIALPLHAKHFVDGEEAVRGSCQIALGQDGRRLGMGGDEHRFGINSRAVRKPCACLVNLRDRRILV